MEPSEIAEIVGLAALAVVGIFVLCTGANEYRRVHGGDVDVMHQSNEYNQATSKKAVRWMVTGGGIVVLSLTLVLFLLL